MIFLLSLPLFLKADDIRLKYVNSPLSEILTNIRNRASLSISFNQKELDKYRITTDTTFTDGVSAIYYLIKTLPFTITLIDGVIVISSNNSSQYVGGVIFDHKSRERLPYANILFGKRVFVSDANGLFRIPNFDLDSVKIYVSYLGYKLLDTTLIKGTENNIYMSPVNITLKSVYIKGYETGMALQSGEEPGLFRINHLVAQYLPGNGDNSVFNLLRMMPGIRAGGEPSELSVWGSKPGESAVIFDGFKLFSMNGFNEQISSINPFMVKEIRLMKGGYNTSYGNQTGAIADIIGVEGSREKATLKLNVNNLTANLFLSAPITKRSTIVAAYRQTYYGLYDVNSLNPFGKRKDSLFVIPDYKFRDANFKISGDLLKRDHYYLSLYGASDNFEYSLLNDNVSLEAFEKNDQICSAGGYSKVWQNGSSTDISVKYSLLDNSSSKISKINRVNIYSIKEANQIEEGGINLTHSLKFLKINNLESGFGAERYRDIYNGNANTKGKVNLFLNDKIVVERLQVNLGIRTDLFGERVYFQPRASIRYSVSDNISTSLSCGLYNQFVGKVPVVYENAAPSIIWKILGDQNFDVLNSVHTVMNLSYSNNFLLMTLEGYNKKTKGLTRIYKSGNRSTIVKGESSYTGVDFFAKMEHRGSQVFASLSVAQANESYMMNSNRNFGYTPVEVKAGTLLNISPLFLSAEYVYGEGFSEPYGTGRYSNYSEETYNRLDVAATFVFNIYGASCKTGLSILNLLNTPNKKTLEFLPSSAQGNQSNLTNLYAESIPFTPTIFFLLNL